MIAPDYARVRRSMLAAMGLGAFGCGPSVSAPAGTEGAGRETGSESSAGSAGASESGDGTFAGSSSGDDPVESSGAVDSTGPALPPPCTPILQTEVEGEPPTGFEVCEDVVHRVAAVTCQSPMPPGDACSVDDQPCATDEDCTERPYGRCVDIFSTCGCRYGCATDADCPDGMLCACGGDGFPDAYPTVTQCVPASCTTDDTCPGERCRLGTANAGCGPFFTAACTTPDDTCWDDVECPPAPVNGLPQTCWPYDPLVDPPYVHGAWDCRLFGQC